MYSNPRSKTQLLFGAAFVCLVQAPLSCAQEIVAGWEGASSRGYSFISPAFVVQRGEPFSLVLRGNVSYLYYDFPEAGGRTKVRSPGQSLDIGLRYSIPGFTASIGPGYEIRQKKSRNAAGGELRENEHGVTVQGDVSVEATPRTTLSMLGSYGNADQYYWVRGGVNQQITNFDDQNAATLHLGAEVTTQGNKDVKTVQLGGLFEIAFPGGGGSLQLRSGYSRTKVPDGSRETRPYFGVGIYRTF
jgi:Cellulose biosynthesis protein BcsS